MGEIAYLSLGSNVGDRAANLKIAIAKLSQVGRVQAISSAYETQPVDVPEQPWFLNCVVAIEAKGSARQLLEACLEVEAEMGRIRTRPRGPRNIDIDVLLFGNQIVDEPGLRIPHPAIALRRFVLEPLAEIGPHVQHPELKKTVREMIAALAPGQIVRRVDFPASPL